MIGRPVAERLAEMRIAFDIEARAAADASIVPSETSALPAPGAAAVWGPYGNGFASVVGAAGSFSSRRSLNTDCAAAASPSFTCKAVRNSDRRASSPPPAPNRAPRRHVIAMTSCRVHGFTSRFDALYSALMPAT